MGLCSDYNREDVLTELKLYFCIEELVDKATYKKHGDSAWKFFDTVFLRTLLETRIILDCAMSVNDWKWGGKKQQRGLRTTLSKIVKDKILEGVLYLSAHVLAKGVDFDAKGMTAEEARKKIDSNQDKLTHKIRFEHKKNGKAISWVHMDTFWEEKNPKVYWFNI